MAEKEFEGWITLDWKDGSISAGKRKPKHMRASEIPIHVRFKVKTPEEKEYEATGVITITETKLDEMLIEEL